MCFIDFETNSITADNYSSRLLEQTMGKDLIKNKRDGSIELLRFCFALAIIGHHISKIYPQVPYIGGYLGVDFFFMISGGFLAKNVKKLETNCISESMSTTLSASNNYLLKRFMSILPYFFISTLIGYFVRIISTGNAISPLYLFNDFFLLIEYGFDAPSGTGTTWYLSAMFISLFVLYPIIRRYYYFYVKYFGMFVSLIIYGTFIHTDGYVGYSNQFLFGFFSAGVLRAIAGMTMGAVAFELAKKLNRFKSVRVKTLFTILGFGLYLSEFYFMHCDNRALDQIEIFIIFFAIIISFSGNHLLSGLLNNKLSYYLGRFSMVLFMNHFYWINFMDSIIKKFSISFLPEWYHRVAASVFLSFITSLVILLIGDYSIIILRKMKHKTLVSHE